MIEVETEVGVFTLRKPTAGIRNAALISASMEGQVNQMKFMIDLLPKCISKHPLGAQLPLKQALDNLDMDVYDKLVTALSDMVKPKDTEQEAKKS
jgi:hypothetical protein